jgi:hypothetical protein
MTTHRTHTEQMRESDTLPGAYDVTEAPRRRRKPAVRFWDTPEGKEITERSNEMFGKFQQEM